MNKKNNFFKIITLVSTILILLGLFEVKKVFSGEVILHTYSYHINVKNLKNFTPGIGYKTKSSIQFGTYYNSYSIYSFYIAKRIKVTNNINFGVGVISGYKLKKKSINGDSKNIIPLLIIEYILTNNSSILIMGQAMQLMLRF